VQQTTTSGHDLRQTANTHGAPSATRVLSAGPSTTTDSGDKKAKKVAVLITPVLLTDREAVALLNVGLRTFLGLQNEAWFPAPVSSLGARAKRHSATELLAAVLAQPRAKRAPEPAQLAAGKASAKRTGQA